MVAASPPILEGDLKISDQNNWGVPEQKIKFGGWGWGGGAKFKGGPKILGGAYEPQWCHGCCLKRYSFMLIRF